MRSFILCFGLLVFFLQACQRKAVPTLSMPDSPKAVSVEEIHFEYLDGKAKMTFRDDKREREVKANIRIRKDSVIWMTFSVVGVQGGKALINKDSITIVSNVDKEYYVFDYNELSARFNFKIDYSVLEAAMLGNPIRPKQLNDMSGREDEYDVLLQTENTVSIKSLISPVLRKIEKVELVESDTNNKLMLQYSNFQPLGEKHMPYNGTASVFYKTAAGLINNTITFEYSKLEIGDKELKFPFNIPKRYDRR